VCYVGFVSAHKCLCLCLSLVRFVRAFVTSVFMSGVCVRVRSESETIKRILNQLQLQQIDARRFEDECRHYKFQNTALQSEVCLLTEDKEKLEYELAQAQESILLLKVIIIT
jgi:hypothetical protein